MNKNHNTPSAYPSSGRVRNLFKSAAGVSVLSITMACGLMLPAHGELVYHGVAAGMLKVDQVNADPADNANCLVTLPFSINDFRIGTFNRADYNVQIGSSGSDDSATGILMTSVAQNGRNNFGTNEFPTPAFAVNGGGDYRIISQSRDSVNGGAFEYNVDVAGAWFPYSQYIGGYARNATNGNGSTNDFFIGSPGLELGTHFVGVANGRSVVNLTSLGIDSRTDGVLLVNHAKDENNWAMSAVNYSNGTWNVTVKDNNSAGAGSVEQDPVAFVFIAKTNTHLISGRFIGNGTIEMFSGTSPQFTVTNSFGGRWDLKMLDGHTPTNGILIISAEGGFSQNQDNIVSYNINEAGDGWEIQSRDTPGNGLQTPGGGVEPVISFVYIPAASPGFSVVPTSNLLTTESGGTTSFTVVLHSLPANDVTVSVTSDNNAEGVVSPSSLTFTRADWNVPQTVTITGQDDGIKDGSVNYQIILSPATSGDAGYNGLKPSDVGVVNADNEAGVTVSLASISTTEAGGTATFDVQLNTVPAADVTIGITSSDVTEGTVAPSSLIFTPANGLTPQTVTVTGVNDSVNDGDVNYTIILATATSSDSEYNGQNPADVAAVNGDDDTAGFTLSPNNGLQVSENGGTANFTIVLSSEPTANVVVSLSPSDSSETSVSPLTLTFTPLNWFTPQAATVTGVNDSINDGDIGSTIEGSITSSDAFYSSLHISVPVTTVDDEALLTLPSGTVVYGIGTPGNAIDPQATVSDADAANYNSGSLTVTLTANAVADDRLEIRNIGTDPGQIGISGSTVSFGGVNIGTVSGGVGSAPLVISFNSAATPVAAQALLRAVIYRNVNNTPSLAARTVTVALADGQGGTSTASKSIILRLMRIFDYQEGVDYGMGTYTGENDIELNNIQSGTPFPSGSAANGLSASVNSTVLLRFDNIIGSGPTQIPTNAIIVSAELILNVGNSGRGGPMHRMLIDWDATNASWDSMGGGVAIDDVMARSTFDSQISVAVATGGATGTGAISVGVTPDIQAWANGEPNFGWVIPIWTFQSGATVFSPGEATNAAVRPHLRVKWIPEGTSIAKFQQGVDGYAGAQDTRTREAAPNTDFSAVANVFVDAEVTGGEADQEQVLIRFDNIFGSEPGQIPPGATIHAAVLDLASMFSDAMGDGGQFFAILKPWEASTSTYNFWSNRGLVPDGIDALTTPTASAGSPELSPDVQGGHNSFELTADVQKWADGTLSNNGWAILPWPRGGNGWGIGLSETATEQDRPRLRVFYSAGVPGIIIQSIQRNATTVSLTFSGEVGSTYSIRRSATVDGSYDQIGTAEVQPNGTATFVDNLPLSNAAFYQVSNP